MALKLGCYDASASSGSGSRSWPGGFLLSPRGGRISRPDLTRAKIPSRARPRFVWFAQLARLVDSGEFPRRHELLDDLVRHALPVFLHALDLVTGGPHPKAAIARGRPSHSANRRRTYLVGLDERRKDRHELRLHVARQHLARLVPD